MPTEGEEKALVIRVAHLERALDKMEETTQRQLTEREKRWIVVERNIDRRLSNLETLAHQILDRQSDLLKRNEFEQLEKRYEERHEKIEIAISLIQARLVPMFWIGAVLVAALIGTFISHIATGTP